MLENAGFADATLWWSILENVSGTGVSCCFSFSDDDVFCFKCC